MEPLRLGLRENWRQFSLLVVVNAFVGGMLGMERAIFPELAQSEFGIEGRTAIFSFIMVFGITKAAANFLSGMLSSRIGRKNLLILGWLFALPVPFILMYTNSWNGVIFANFLLGINQGLTWTGTVVMKIDLVGEKDRGLAMGLNEFAGYLSLAAVAFLTGWIASEFGVRPFPFFIGVVLAFAGLLTTILFIRDTHAHVALESSKSQMPLFENVFRETTWRNKQLGSVTQAGFVNNLNDGMIWGLLPLLLAAKGFELKDIGLIAAIYPAVWGVTQLFTGRMADLICKKKMLFAGMLIQGIAIILYVLAQSFLSFALISLAIGIGTAMVYPTFLAAISENTHPKQRTASIGTFRLWRDLGYAFGALISGVLADKFGIAIPVVVVGVLTVLSSVVIQFRMNCLKPMASDNMGKFPAQHVLPT